jgi:ribosomal-protein-alanine N-acetyltransferase
MKFALDESDVGQLLTHLQGADVGFIPPLSTRLNLSAYADKMVKNARRVEAWDSQVLAGCIAIYADRTAGVGFITNVSVLPSYQGSGLASQLLKRALDLAVALGLVRVRLEVHADNAAARALYRRHGFQQDQSASLGAGLILERELK